jgi:hypothetical protein
VEQRHLASRAAAISRCTEAPVCALPSFAQGGRHARSRSRKRLDRTARFAYRESPSPTRATARMPLAGCAAAAQPISIGGMGHSGSPTDSSIASHATAGARLGSAASEGGLCDAAWHALLQGSCGVAAWGVVGRHVIPRHGVLCCTALQHAEISLYFVVAP